MASKKSSQSNRKHPTRYQIRLQGHLDPQWTIWFDGLTVTLEEDGITLLTGTVIDQAALHGLLKKVRDLGMPLLSVNAIDSNDNPQDDHAQDHDAQNYDISNQNNQKEN